LAVEFLPALQQ
jgi:hypothetical protein